MARRYFINKTGYSPSNIACVVRDDDGTFQCQYIDGTFTHCHWNESTIASVSWGLGNIQEVESFEVARDHAVALIEESKAQDMVTYVAQRQQ